MARDSELDIQAAQARREVQETQERFKQWLGTMSDLANRWKSERDTALEALEEAQGKLEAVGKWLKLPPWQTPFR